MFFLPFFIRETYRNLTANRVSVVLAVISNSVALVIFGILLLLFFNTSRFFSTIRGNIRIICYIEDQHTPAELSDYEARILEIPGVSRARFISKKQALEQFQKKLGTELLNGFDDNPLPASFEVFIKKGDQYQDDLDAIGASLAELGPFSEVQYGRKWIGRLSLMMDYFNLCIVIVFLIVSFSTMVIISNITKLTILMRKDEIKIMKYIGASNAIIRIPFILEGAVLGIIGSAASVIFLRMLFQLFKKHLWTSLQFQGKFEVLFIPYGHVMTILFLSVAVGMVATFFPVKSIT